MLGIAFGITASLCWGMGDFLGGITTRRVPGMVVVAASQAIGLCALGVVVVVQPRGFPGIVALLPGILAGALGAVGIAALYRALAIGLMSIVAPIAAMSAAIPVIVGAVEGQSPSGWQVAGMILAGAGVIIASSAGDDEESDSKKRRQSILLAVCTATSLGFVLIGVHLSAENGAFWAVFSARVTSVIVLLLFLVALRASPPTLAGNGRALVAIGILDVSGILFFALASVHGLLGVVSVAASLYPVVTILMARLVLHERVRGLQSAGMTAALIGVVLLAI